MPRWREIQSYDLQRTGDAGPREVRVVVVEREGLWRGFNVREVRGSAAQGQAAPGHWLSCLPMSEEEAKRQAKLRYERWCARGYTRVFAAGEAKVAGPEPGWDWMARLLVHESSKEPLTATATAESFLDAVESLRLGDGTFEQGLAACLGLTPEQLRFPSLAILRRVDVTLLSVMIPSLCLHPRAPMAEIGARWLELPTLLYELPREVVCAWCCGDDRVAQLLAHRLPREGLALLGFDALAQLRSRAQLASIRQSSLAWRSRLSPIG